MTSRKSAAESQTIIDDHYTANPDTDIFMTLGPNGANPFYAFLDAAGLGPGDVFHGTFDLSEEIIAKINGEIVLRSDFDRYLADIRRETERDNSIPPEQKDAHVAEREKSILRDLIDERLLVQKGEELGVNVELYRGDDLLSTLEPKLNRYPNGQLIASPSVDTGIRGDFYVSLTGRGIGDDPERIRIEAFWRPFIWFRTARLSATPMPPAGW